MKSKNRRALLAAAFLFVLVAEWGSHSVICHDHSSGEAQSFSSKDVGHEDPCQTLVLCSDNKQRDQQTPTFSHDASQHNGLVDIFAALTPELTAYREPQIASRDAVRIFRPPKPLFHPPKQA